MTSIDDSSMVNDAPSIEDGRCSRIKQLLLLLPVRAELFEKRNHVLPLLLILQAGKDHFGVRHHRLRRCQIFVEFLRRPDKTGILVGI